MTPQSQLKRFSIAYILLVLLISITVGVAITGNLQRESLERAKDQLRDEAGIFARLALSGLQGGQSPRDLAEILAGSESLGDLRVTVVRQNGAVVADSAVDPAQADNLLQRPEIVEALSEGIGFTRRVSPVQGREMLYCALQLRCGDQACGFVRTAMPLERVSREFRATRRIILAGALVLGGISLLLGLYLMRGALRPLSARTRAAESEAAGSRERLATILASMSDGVVAVDRDQHVVHMNAAAGALFELHPEQCIGVPVWKVLRNSEILDALDSAQTELTEGEIILHADAQTGSGRRIVELRAAPLKKPNGEVGGAVLVFHDLTRLRHLESVRQDFVANVSHEIKTPLSAIHGIVETMIDDPEMSSVMQEHFLLRMLEQSQRLGNLVRDLIALSRFESEDLPLDLEELDLRQPILDARERFDMSAREKELSLVTDLPDHPVWVEGDGEALRQVFDNLLSNAVRYTPEGGHIMTRLKEERGVAWAEVEDSGIGIAEEHLGRIFERFYRVDKARSREQGGTGLGLSIVKHIASRMGGGVSVRSQAGSGTTFCVHLPLSKSESSPSPHDSEP